MADNLDNDELDKIPLLKIKKPRPPPSEKQRENFKKMAEKRAENVQKRKEEKLFEAQKALVEKHNISTFKKAGGKEEPIKKLKEQKETVQFEIEELTSDSDEEISEPIVKQKKIKAKQVAPVDSKKKEKERKKIKPEPVIEESETDYSSDSSEEIIVIKRGKKKPKAAKAAKAVKQQKEEEEEEEEYVAEVQNPVPNFINYFC